MTAEICNKGFFLACAEVVIVSKPILRRKVNANVIICAGIVLRHAQTVGVFLAVVDSLVAEKFTDFFCLEFGRTVIGRLDVVERLGNFIQRGEHCGIQSFKARLKLVARDGDSHAA